MINSKIESAQRKNEFYVRIYKKLVTLPLGRGNEDKVG